MQEASRRFRILSGGHNSTTSRTDNIRKDLARERLLLLKTRLTPREVETATWVARGRTYAQIAHLLSITEDTAKFHMENVRRKLNASNKTHAIALALVNCLIQL